MTRRGLIRAAALAAIGLASLGGSPARGPAYRSGSLCSPAEQTLFSCPIGGKLASVCGRNGAAVYRFGRPARIELQAQGLRFAEHDFSGGGESQITFENKGFRYILYDSVTRTGFGANGRHDPQEKVGLIVRSGATVLSDRMCGASPQAVVDSSAAKVMPGGDFVSH